MTPDQATKTLRGAEIMIAQLLGDASTVALIASEVADPGPLADGLVYVAVSAGLLVAGLDGSSLRHALEALPRFDVRLLPHAPSTWDPVVDLAVGVANGDARLIRESIAGLDVPTVINSAFALALSACAVVAEKIERNTVDLLRDVVAAAEHDL